VVGFSGTSTKKKTAEAGVGETDSTSYSKIKQNWTGIRLPIRLVDSIDEFLRSDIAKKQGIFSRSDFIIRMAISWFAQYDSDYRWFMRAPRSPIPLPSTWKEGPKRFERELDEQLEIMKKELLRRKETEEEEEERRRESMVRVPDVIYKIIDEMPQDKREEFYKGIYEKQRQQQQRREKKEQEQEQK
jgi:hypothetical protein